MELDCLECLEPIVISNNQNLHLIIQVVTHNVYLYYAINFCTGAAAIKLGVSSTLLDFPLSYVRLSLFCQSQGLIKECWII